MEPVTSYLPNSEPVPFNDLSVQWRAIADQVRADFDDVFARSVYCLGPYVDAFERDLATWLGVNHAIGVNSGTSALHLAMICSGIGAGDEVLLPAHTFIATAAGVQYVGATPVLCDVDAAAGTIDIADAEKRITGRTKAIIPVHLYGQPANMDAVMALSLKYNLMVIEDAAQSIGASWNNRMTGTIGDFGCFSFYPGKNLGAAGEAGLVVTSNEAVASRLRSLRHHGQSERYTHQELGYNYRLDALQAVVLRQKLPLLREWIAQRKVLAATYSHHLSDTPLELPTTVHQDHVWHLYVVRTNRRNELRAHLDANNIETGVHYPIPLHHQPSMARYQFPRAGFPITERWAIEGLSLPLFVGMTAIQQRKVIGAVKDFFAND